MENYSVYLVNQKVEVASDFLKPKTNTIGYLEAKPFFQHPRFERNAVGNRLRNALLPHGTF
jgi:hypothetical protein